MLTEITFCNAMQTMNEQLLYERKIIIALFIMIFLMDAYHLINRIYEKRKGKQLIPEVELKLKDITKHI